MVLRVMLWVWKIPWWVLAKFKCRLVYTRLLLVKVTVTQFLSVAQLCEFMKRKIKIKLKK